MGRLRNCDREVSKETNTIPGGAVFPGDESLMLMIRADGYLGQPDVEVFSPAAA